MKKKNKKGFTIVELVVVVAIIAILAAVLIPTFTSIIKKSQLSVDQQMVDGMNTVLQIEEAASGKPASLDAAKEVLESNNYRGTITPVTTDHEFYWIPAENRVVLVKMNGDSPDSIEYPRNLAEKYSAVLPASWYKFSGSSSTEEVCSHENKKYVAIANDDGSSEYHIGICGNCNIVITASEAHDTNGSDGACSKCGWKEDTSHTHDYAEKYLSDNNGHHYGVCSCGAIDTREDCAYDGDGKCEKCNYVKPTEDTEYTHQFTYTPADPYTGTHTKACSVEGCSISEVTENCAYGLNKKCIYCGADMPEDVGVRNGLVNGTYYQNDKPFTGTVDGYKFKEGNLVLTGEKGNVTLSGNYIDNKLTFNVPTDERYLTNKIILNFGDCNEYLKPGSYGGTELSVVNASSYKTVSLKAEGLDDLNAAISELRTAIANGNTDGILNTLSTTYGITEIFYPKMTASDDFIAYMKTLDVSLTSSSNSLSDADYKKYVTSVAEGKSYAKYLKDKYNVSSLSNLPWTARANDYASSYGVWPSSNTAKAHGIFSGNDLDRRMAEPELVLLTFEHFYKQIAFVGVSDSDPTKLIKNAASIEKNFYQCDTENWQSGVSTQYGVKLYSHIEASDGQILNVSNMNQFFVFTAAHGWLMSNAFQDYEIFVPTFEIILEKSA